MRVAGITCRKLLEDTIRSFEEIIDGKHDDIPEQAFYMTGTIEDVRQKAGVGEQ